MADEAIQPKASSLRVALTKRALELQLMRAGSPKRDAERISARLAHIERWQKLPLRIRAEIAWKCVTRK